MADLLAVDAEEYYSLGNLIKSNIRGSLRPKRGDTKSDLVWAPGALDTCRAKSCMYNKGICRVALFQIQQQEKCTDGMPVWWGVCNWN